ncbi:bifunctional proline dehydrogenase/L-glutamate gamma-semialdehyde dehydrogenase PutA [Thaumasiovibrio subtropicus]|uniref:bifunctional proline dehydrogenase/L-glutamate gamma-semialdehyde dehydrogenase PutA n=1 Tax=Thaumasiovibrio subtropicus TaxID=1891207 RepID=UPI000B34DBDF|nr:bifunctional proline dehydrogenase/L-glutamate gamma-semialdehyde dehydrogenase PutA [Thaumasiovibrio subtropicus]
MIKAEDYFVDGWLDQSRQTLWEKISPLYAVDESAWIAQLIPFARNDDQEGQLIGERALALINQVRADKDAVHMIDALLMEYSLDTDEGVLLMCLAEALMRIPDQFTADAFIRDKLSVADWQAHLKNSKSVFVNASTWGLLLTGKVTSFGVPDNPSNVLKKMVNKLSEPVIRKAMQQAMQIMGFQFVLGRSIEEAMKKGEDNFKQGNSYSFDMLGEAALTRDDAAKYLADYRKAIDAVGATQQDRNYPPSVSIKLSALYPRYEASNYNNVMTEMYQTLLALLIYARDRGVAITVDAEEADRLEISLQLFEKLLLSDALKGWGGFGLVVQAYSKRALSVLAWLTKLSEDAGVIIPVRLVKGAYWDSEIKHCQQLGLQGYPVYTRKESTDVAYLACARFLFSASVIGRIYPQFASHNAHTVTAIATMAPETAGFEFQRLHGMGDALYKHVTATHGKPVRIYAPVGSHKDLLPYLVRRLLENGANSSFVHRLVDARCPAESLVEHPVDTLQGRETLHHPAIVLPPAIFGENRKNSRGFNVQIHSDYTPLAHAIQSFRAHQWQGASIVNGQAATGDATSVTAPYLRTEKVGDVVFGSAAVMASAVDVAQAGFAAWSERPVSERAACLRKIGDLLEQHHGELISLCHREAGKTMQDSVDEIREAVDFCHYYATQAEALMANPKAVKGLEGAEQLLRYQAKGIVLCISPWNFPLAIFLGQIAAALVTGNTVVAKPAPQTSLIAVRCIELMLDAGVPADVIQLVLGGGDVVGDLVANDDRIKGVVFTGSTATAKLIQSQIARRDAPALFIAETGGLNAMVVDSTALPEQVVRDVIRSAFASAGQRCSALRVLFVQQEIAPRIVGLIKGAMAELQIGDPNHLVTDVGPVIDDTAKQRLQAHITEHKDKVLYQSVLSPECDGGDFVAPTMISLDAIQQLSEEKFGPILHVISFDAQQLEEVIGGINQTGYGLTLGVHSRNERTYQTIEEKTHVGNCYINRDQVGAVVGVQPFGGHGLSGTGPKAGGPHYLTQFVDAVLGGE